MTDARLGELTERERGMLLAYRAAPEWKKVRIDALAALMARVMLPGDSDRLYEQISGLFIDAPPAKPLRSIIREAWECIHRSRITEAAG